MITQILCSIRGHDLIKQFDGIKIYVRCQDCGWQSRGIRVKQTCPTVLSGAEIDDIYNHMMDVEYSLHGGG